MKVGDNKLTLNERLQEIILEASTSSRKLTKNDLRGVVFMVNAAIHNAVREVKETSVNNYN